MEYKLQKLLLLEFNVGDGDTDTTKFEIGMSKNRSDYNNVTSAEILLPGETIPHRENFPYITTESYIRVIPPEFGVQYFFKITPMDNAGEFGLALELPVVVIFEN